jgi:hypothetical protein
MNTADRHSQSYYPGLFTLRSELFPSAGRSMQGCRRTPGARWTQPEVARRWGLWATTVAALCPMPYVLVRLTRLLPNPIGTSADQLHAEPAIRMFGLGLGAVASCAGLVTLGLIRPCGENSADRPAVRWVPVLAGRPVPIRAPVIPGYDRQPAAVHRQSVAVLAAAPGQRPVDRGAAPVPVVGYVGRAGHRGLLLPPPHTLHHLRPNLTPETTEGPARRRGPLSFQPIRCPGSPTSAGRRPRRSPVPVPKPIWRCR